MPHQAFESCIEACNECAVVCDHCAVSCLQEQDPNSMADCIRLDMDCAEICRTTTAFMSRGSTLAAQVCQMCAEVCSACADECARFSMDHCQQCAQACRRCADECRRMAAQPPTSTRQSKAAGASAH